MRKRVKELYYEEGEAVGNSVWANGSEVLVLGAGGQMADQGKERCVRIILNMLV